MVLLKFNANAAKNSYVLLRQVMPVFERVIKLAVESERRLISSDFKRSLDATEQDIFTRAQIERLLEDVMVQRGQKNDCISLDN